MQISDSFKPLVAAHLKALRRGSGLSQDELADILSEKLEGVVSKTSISLWENGHQTPKVDKLRAYQDIFGCSMDYLTGKTEAPTKESAAFFDWSYRESWKTEKKKRRKAFIGFAAAFDIGLSQEGKEYKVGANTIEYDPEPKARWRSVSCSPEELDTLIASAATAVESVFSAFIAAKKE